MMSYEREMLAERLQKQDNVMFESVDDAYEFISTSPIECIGYLLDLVEQAQSVGR